MSKKKKVINSNSHLNIAIKQGNIYVDVKLPQNTDPSLKAELAKQFANVVVFLLRGGLNKQIDLAIYKAGVLQNEEYIADTIVEAKTEMIVGEAIKQKITSQPQQPLDPNNEQETMTASKSFTKNTIINDDEDDDEDEE